MKRTVIGSALLGLLLVMAIAGCSREPVPVKPTPTAGAPVKGMRAGERIVAEGRVTPVKNADLSLSAAGIVSEVLVSEGDPVKKDQLLVRVNSKRQAAAVAQAQANLAVTEAQLVRLQAGATAEDIAAAEQAVEVARAGLKTPNGAVASAQANLNRLQAGATQEDIAIAQRRVEQAKNVLWNIQNKRDSVCGVKGLAKSECDSAQAEVGRAEEEVHITELQLQQTQKGPRKEDVAVAQAQLQQAQGQLATAQAQVHQAEANLAKVTQGATAADIAAAQAQVDQARAAVEQAKVALAETELRAPFDGVVVTLNVKIGEVVPMGSFAVRMADLSAWQIETTDLTELNIAKVSEGIPTSMTFDALPGLELPGKVTKIRPYGESKQGDIVYTVIITPDQQDARLRWNMTAKVSIEAK